MRKVIRPRISLAVLVMIIGAIFFGGKWQRASAQIDGFVTYYLYVHCGDTANPSKIFGHEVTEGGTEGRPLMGTHTECAGNCDGGTRSLENALAFLPAPVKAKLQWQVDQYQAANTGTAERLNCLGDGKDQVKYTGEITCDCNGDGKDDFSKSFESYGLPQTSWPTSFQSRCEDWVTGDGGFTYSTDTAIQRAGADWLGSLKCPAIKCHQNYDGCMQRANSDYQTCGLNAFRLLTGTTCLQLLDRANTKCKRTFDTCMKGIRRFGPGTAPKPRPAPTPARTPGDFRP